LRGFRGSARWRRKFGYPGRIDAFEHVWLTCAGCSGCREVHLNGHDLTSAGAVGSSFEFEVTSLLTDRNHLEVLIQGDTDEAGLWGEVALEIRRDAWLKDLRLVATEAGARLDGRAIGSAPGPLEMYTLIDGRHADYRTIQPTPQGQRFQIDLPGSFSASTEVRIDLIDVSTIWYAASVPLGH
jgi:hypothetical protein